MRVHTRANRVINHRGKNSANSLEKHARFPYNDMQMYLTTIPHGVCDPVVSQTNRIRRIRVLARVSAKFHNRRNGYRRSPPIEIHNGRARDDFNLFIDILNILSNETTVFFFLFFFASIGSRAQPRPPPAEATVDVDAERGIGGVR